MPRGSSAAFTRRVMRGQWLGFRRHYLNGGAERLGRAHQRPGAVRRASGGFDRAHAWRRSAGPASQTRPPPQSRKPVQPASAAARRTAGPAEGRTETRQTASLSCASSGRALPTARQTAWEASSSRISAMRQSQRVAQLRRAVGDGRAKIFDPQQRHSAAEGGQFRHQRRRFRRQPGGAGDRRRASRARPKARRPRRRHRGRAAPTCPWLQARAEP